MTININPKKILVRAPNWVGDVVMATPAFRCIRENFKDAKITVLIKKNLSGIINGTPWFDEVIEFVPVKRKNLKGPSKHSDKVFYGNIKDYLCLVHKLRKEEFDLGFLFPNSFSSAFTLWLSGVKKRIGYKRDARSLLLTDGLDRLKEDGKFKPTYMADFHLKMCEYLGCKVKSRELELFITDDCEKAANELFDKYQLNEGPFILINPGASFGTSKYWTAEGFARTSDMLKEIYDCNIVLTCGPGEERLVDEIDGLSKNKLINLSREQISLDVYKVFVKRCKLLITLDSGPRHFAVALKGPVIVLMGPNDPRYTASKYEIGKVIRVDIDCSPCQLKTCPTDRRCMTMITPEDVVQACRNFLDDQAGEQI